MFLAQRAAQLGAAGSSRFGRRSSLLKRELQVSSVANSAAQPSTSSTGSPMTKPKISVSVISDTVCPWCFVGKRRLEEAIKRMSNEAEFEVTWLPYQLNPNAPKEGINKYQYYLDKFGPRVSQIVPQMERTYAELGLKYSLGGLTGNTLDSHRLIEWALHQGGPGVQNALVEELFRNYFTEEKYIGDREVLLAAAAKAGLDREAAAQYLDDPQAGLAEVQEKLRAGRTASMTGVPHFIINNKLQVGGAQSPEVFQEAFRRVLASA